MTDSYILYVDCAWASVKARRPVFMCTHKYQMLKDETCGHENWSLTFREERSTRVFENRVLRKIVGPKRDEVTGEWRRLHNEEHHVLYYSLSIIRLIRSRIMRYRGQVAGMGNRRGAYRVLVGRGEGKKPFGRHRHRWKNNIKMGLQEVGWGDMDCSHLAQDRERWRAIANVVMSLRSP